MPFNFPLLRFSLNVGCGPAEERILLTGLHAVADIYCENCKTTLGWKYVSRKYYLFIDLYQIYLVLLVDQNKSMRIVKISIGVARLIKTSLLLANQSPGLEVSSGPFADEIE